MAPHGQCGSFDQANAKRPDYFEYQTNIEHEVRLQFSAACHGKNCQAANYRGPYPDEINRRHAHGLKNVIGKYRVSPIVKERMRSSGQQSEHSQTVYGLVDEVLRK